MYGHRFYTDQAINMAVTGWYITHKLTLYVDQFCIYICMQ